MLENIVKQFRSGRGVVKAVDDISLVIEENITAILFGKSGSGKTTLLNCIGGLDRPDTGKVNISGIDLHSLSEKKLSLYQRRNIGFVFQHSNLLTYLTVLQNIAFPLELKGIKKKQIEKHVAELLEGNRNKRDRKSHA